MSLTETLADVVSLESIRVQKLGPVPQKVLVQNALDSDGEPVLRVYLVYPNSVPEETLRWKKIRPLLEWVRTAVENEDPEGRYVFVKARREKDLAFASA